jgi:putative hydrolase of the HAD superfamily
MANPLHLMLQKKRVLLFDLFHTLTDRIPTHKPTTSEILGIQPKDWNEQLFMRSRARHSGELRDPYEIIRKMAHAIDSSISEAKIEFATNLRMQRFNETLEKIPQSNVIALQKLRSLGKKIVLVSNADFTEIIAWNRSPIAPLFDATIFSCEVGFVKPEREIYELAMNKLSAVVADCAFIGDGACNELEGAKNLGMTTVMMKGIVQEIYPDEIPHRRKFADYEIDRIIQLVEN